MPRITLGDRVRDPITGFEGIAVVRSTWLHTRERIGVQPETLDKDGKPIEVQHFDEAQIEVVESGVRAPKDWNEPRPPGGPDRREPNRSRQVDPSR